MTLPSREDFELYERLRKEGRGSMYGYCMLDPDLKQVMKHYDELRAMYPESVKED